MTAELPQEHVSKSILPLLRGALSHCLHGRGMSQHKIARLLGVTQPMVYKYLQGSMESYVEGLADLGVSPTTVKLIVESTCERLAGGMVGELAGAANILALSSNYCRENRELCESTLCSKEPPEVRVYNTVLKRLTSIHIYDLIPEVGSNLAYAPRGASSISEVLGLEGRIIRGAPGHVIIAGAPAYGASKHTGGVALKYARAWGSEAWATVLKYTPSLLEALREYHDLAVEVERGEGMEPVIYVASRDPQRLLEAVEAVTLRLVKPGNL